MSAPETIPAEVLGLADRIVEIARCADSAPEAEQEIARILADQAARPASPAQGEVEVVAWLCTDLIFRGGRDVVWDADHAGMRAAARSCGEPAWAVDPLVRKAAYEALLAERDEAREGRWIGNAEQHIRDLTRDLEQWMAEAKWAIAELAVLRGRVETAASDERDRLLVLAWALSERESIYRHEHVAACKWLQEQGAMLPADRAASRAGGGR